MPNASISKRSTPNQVKGWLKAGFGTCSILAIFGKLLKFQILEKSLNFSEITVESLGELNGAQIFTLSKEELRQVMMTS